MQEEKFKKGQNESARQSNRVPIGVAAKAREADLILFGSGMETKACWFGCGQISAEALGGFFLVRSQQLRDFCSESRVIMLNIA